MGLLPSQVPGLAILAPWPGWLLQNYGWYLADCQHGGHSSRLLTDAQHGAPALVAAGTLQQHLYLLQHILRLTLSI